MAQHTAAATSSKSPRHDVASSTYTEPQKVSLPLDGMSRWGQIAQFSPVSREKFRQLVNAGKAPPAVRLSERCTCYSNRELHRFFADPLNYSIEVK